MSNLLPFDIKKMSAGAQKAFEEFVKFYGPVKGADIYLRKAEEQGVGNTIREKVNSIYHKGAKLK
jgi:hypothetical protein